MIERMDHHGHKHRRHRRLSTSPDAISWVSYVVLMIRRHYHWMVLVAFVAGILLVSMGAPLLPVDDWMSFGREFF